MTYTPPEGKVILVRDSFDNAWSTLPNRGRWLPFVGRDNWTNPLAYSNKTLESNWWGGDPHLYVYMRGAGYGDGESYLGVLTRCEFRPPFTLKFNFRVPSNPDAPETRFQFSLIDPNGPWGL